MAFCFAAVGCSAQLEQPSGDALSSNAQESADSTAGDEAVTLYVQFGDNGESFPLHLHENDTAAAIARHVGTADWRLPIYHYDDYENWEVMQYYDIPSRYEIPFATESIETEAAGTVYYSEAEPYSPVLSERGGSRRIYPGRLV